MQQYQSTTSANPLPLANSWGLAQTTETMKNRYKSTSGAIGAPLGAANAISDAICTKMGGKWALNGPTGRRKRDFCRHLYQNWELMEPKSYQWAL